MFSPVRSKFLFIAFSILMSTSCTTVTEVQLYTEYLTAEEIESITKLLQSPHYKVVANPVNVPDGLQRSTLIYSPLNRHIDQVNQLIDILSGSPFGAPYLELTGKENHFYGKDTVGLYIVTSDHIKPKTISSTYAVEYNGRCNTVDANLLLKEDGKAILMSHIWDEVNNGEISSQSQGQWHYQNHTIYVSINGNDSAEFLVTRREESGKNGFTEYRLKNNGVVPFFDDCDFVYRALTY